MTVPIYETINDRLMKITEESRINIKSRLLASCIIRRLLGSRQRYTSEDKADSRSRVLLTKSSDGLTCFIPKIPVSVDYEGDIRLSRLFNAFGPPVT